MWNSAGNGAEKAKKQLPDRKVTRNFEHNGSKTSLEAADAVFSYPHISSVSAPAA